MAEDWREQLVAPLPWRTRLECPLSACDWHHDQPSPIVNLNAGTPEDDQRVEGIIRAHVETHAVEEWMREIQRLRAELQAAQAELAVADEDRRRGL